MTFLVGSYPLAPADTGAPAFAELVGAFARNDLVGGMELPSHHLQDPRATAAIVSHAPPGWTFAVTCFPGTMLAMAADPAVGLASVDQDGRQTALEQLAQLREQALRLDGDLGGGRVRSLRLHSAPRGGDPDCLAASLDEITEWDWSGVRIDIEHCDAAVPGHPAEKGFLSLEDELKVLDRPGDGGVVVNWARSAIETRSADGPVDHLTLARRAGRLRSLVFSGVAAVDTAFGPAWVDAHLPASTVTPESLLTPAELRRAVQAAGPDVELGVKISLGPGEIPVARAVGALDQMLHDLDVACAAPSA